MPETTKNKRPQGRIDPDDETKMLGVKIPCRMKEQLEKMAKKKDLTSSQLARIILENGLQQIK